MGKRVNRTKAVAADQLVDLWNSAMEDCTTDEIKSLVLKKILNKDVSQKALLYLIFMRNLPLSIV